MGCCSRKINHQENKEPCPLCSIHGNSIHYLAVQMLVEEELISKVTKEEYFVCANKFCDVVFFNKYKDRIFLPQDINMKADFNEVTKSNQSKCNKKCKGCNK